MYVCQHFQTSPQKPLGQSKSNFIWSLHEMGEWKFVQLVQVTWSRCDRCPYMVKKIIIFFFGTKRPLILKLDIQHRVLEYYQVCSNDDPGLTFTYFTARSNLVPFRNYCSLWCQKLVDAVNYEGWSKSLFLFLIQRKVRILSKFCDVHIEIKYISSNRMLFEKQLCRHSLWHMTSRDIPKGAIEMNRFLCVASAKLEIFFHNKKHLIHLRNVHLKLIATDPNTI